MAQDHNPFSTRYIAPGCIPFLVGENPGTADAFFVSLHTQWINSGRVGAIIGPHGCGKSTLLAALERAWTNKHAYRVTNVTLHNGQRTLPAVFWQRDFLESDLVVVDGYEQLGWRARWQLNHLRRRTLCGLLVTTHASTRLPTLHRVESDYATLLAVVRRLLAPLGDSPRVESFILRYVPSAWQLTGTNARETLFRLYDCWETEVAQLVRAGTE